MSETSGDNSPQLDRISASWRRRGYDVRYQDQFLVQLAKRQTVNIWLLVVLLLLGLGLIALAIVLARLPRRGWHVVTITEAPDGRIITHAMWSPRPPDD